MKVLVIGSEGQLGQELKNLSKTSSHDYFFVDRPEIDISQKEAVSAFFEKQKFDYVVNTAAYTAVDLAETEKESAFAVNAKALEYLTSAAKKQNFRLLHFSTDFVFDGKKGSPYLPTDQCQPLNQYGLSKRAGELVCLDSPSSRVIRTSWLYSPFGKNFVKSIRGLIESGRPLKIVSDQKGSPTYAGDLASFVDSCLIQIFEKSAPILHFCNQGDCSWFEFAQEISRQIGGESPIEPISSAEYGAPAHRPADSRLDCRETDQAFDFKRAAWKDSLSKMLKISS